MLFVMLMYHHKMVVRSRTEVSCTTWLITRLFEMGDIQNRDLTVSLRRSHLCGRMNVEELENI